MDKTKTLSKKGQGKVKNDVLKEIMEREKEHHLSMWCMEQAKLHHEGKLSKDKVKKLKTINFPFDYYLALYDKHNMTFEEFEKDEEYTPEQELQSIARAKRDQD